MERYLTLGTLVAAVLTGLAGCSPDEGGAGGAASQLGGGGAGGAAGGGEAGSLAGSGEAGAGAGGSGQAGEADAPACTSVPRDGIADFTVQGIAAGGLPACAFTGGVTQEVATVTAVTAYEEPGTTVPHGTSVALTFLARNCGAVLALKTLDSRVRFDVGEALRMSWRVSGAEEYLVSTLAIEDAAGALAFAVSNGAAAGGVDSDLMQGLQLQAEGPGSCTSPAGGLAPATLATATESCALSPLGRACCALLGGTLDVRVRGLFPRLAPLSGSPWGDFTLTAPARALAIGAGAGTICP